MRAWKNVKPQRAAIAFKQPTRMKSSGSACSCSCSIPRRTEKVCKRVACLRGERRSASLRSRVREDGGSRSSSSGRRGDTCQAGFWMNDELDRYSGRTSKIREGRGEERKAVAGLAERRRVARNVKVEEKAWEKKRMRKKGSATRESAREDAGRRRCERRCGETEDEAAKRWREQRST